MKRIYPSASYGSRSKSIIAIYLVLVASASRWGFPSLHLLLLNIYYYSRRVQLNFILRIKIVRNQLNVNLVLKFIQRPMAKHKQRALSWLPAPQTTLN